MPIPPPPPGGWSGVCKTVIDPASGTPKVSVLASADQVSKQVNVQKEDAETLKMKKEEKKARQKVAKSALYSQVVKSDSDKVQGGKKDDPEAVPEGKLPDSFRGGSSGTVDGSSQVASSSGPLQSWTTPWV